MVATGLILLVGSGLAGATITYRWLFPGPPYQEIIVFPPADTGTPATVPPADTGIPATVPPATVPPTLYERLEAGPGVIYATDFSSLDPEWTAYHSPGHAGRGLRRPSAVTIEPATAPAGDHYEADSILRITARMGTGVEAGQLVSGGLALGRPQTYGTYTFRMRVDPDPDRATSGVALLWPASERWPEHGEIDMFETWVNRDTRIPVETNIHYLWPEAEPPYDPSDDRLLSAHHRLVDGTRWHVYRFEWRPDRLVMTIDGGQPRILTTDPTRIPHWDMVPTFQLDAFPTPDRPDDDPVLTGEVALEVDWFVITG